MVKSISLSLLPRRSRVIFYTLQGPKYNLEIHDDKIRLVRKGWSRVFTSSKDAISEWRLTDLAQFQISRPKVIWGKLEWSTFDGQNGACSFSTNAVMVGKIERYLHKLIIKNLNRRQVGTSHEATPAAEIIHGLPAAA